MKKPDLYIGIDPGRETGVALWWTGLKKCELKTMDFWSVIVELNIRCIEGAGFYVRIEDPNKNRPTFGKLKGGALARKSQDVGRNKEHAYLIIQYCERHNIPYTAIQPTQKKWDHETFNNILKGINGQTFTRTNQHQRDAARFVIGL